MEFRVRQHGKQRPVQLSWPALHSSPLPWPLPPHHLTSQPWVLVKSSTQHVAPHTCSQEPFCLPGQPSGLPASCSVHPWRPRSQSSCWSSKVNLWYEALRKFLLFILRTLHTPLTTLCSHLSPPSSVNSLRVSTGPNPSLQSQRLQSSLPHSRRQTQICWTELKALAMPNSTFVHIWSQNYSWFYF